MAIVQLKNVEVIGVNQSGFGIRVVEQSERDGKTYSQRFTLWFKEAHGLNVGTKINASGFLGTKVGEPWTDNNGLERRSVEVSLNNPRLEGTPAQSDDTPF
jgi:hypothetical protein